jgi:putative ATPase
MAAAAKSNAVYQAFNTAMADVKSLPSYEVPKHLRNAPTKLMKKLDHGRDYRYAHDEDEGYAVGENYFPDELRGKHYYFPVERGLEQKIAEKLRYLRGKDQTAKN